MNKEERIKQIAYELWEKDGRPDGMAAAHYYRAERIWMSEGRQDGADAASAISPVVAGAPATPSTLSAGPTKRSSKK